jgi:predicted RNA-binding Zn ribbon-like protein
MLWPVALSAAEVPTSDPRRRVARCTNKDCTWLFLYSGKQGRIWCDSAICGNRYRGKRHYRQFAKPSRISI